LAGPAARAHRPVVAALTRVALDGPTCDRLELGPQASVNNSQLTTAYTVTVDLPGVEVSKIETSLDGRTLTVSAETESVKEDTEKVEGDAEFIRRERHVGRFQRNIVFEKPVRAEGISQNLEEGVLKITVPKAKTEK